MAIHEVMEQQTVTIAKAGIHASLNARCSVLAAANPVYGQYDRQRRPQENIGLPDSLISRFDLLFIILDQLDANFDRMLSEHVITSHQYRRPGTIMEPEPLNQVSHLSLEDPSERLLDATVWLRGGPNPIRGGNHQAAAVGDRNSAGDVFTKEFLRRYIHFAKNRMNPVLSDDAMDAISTKYAEIRGKQTKRNLPVTARTLETIIRLSSASAKIRLSDSVTVADVDIAMELLNYCLYHEIGESDLSANGNTQSNTSTASNQTVSDENRPRNERKSSRNTPSKESKSNDESEDSDLESTPQKKVKFSQSLEENGIQKVQQAIQELSYLSDEISVKSIIDHIQKQSETSLQTDNLREILYKLEAQNKVSQ